MPSAPLLLLSLLLAALPAQAQPAKGGGAPPAAPARPEVVSCTRLEGASAGPQTVEALGYRLGFRDGRVTTILLDLPDGRSTRTELEPGRREGTSIRLIVFPRPGQPGIWNTVFNEAMVQPDGTVLIETWLGATDRPGAAPWLNWYRLRCGASAGPPAGGGG